MSNRCVGTYELPTVGLVGICRYFVGTSFPFFTQIQTLSLSHRNGNGEWVPTKYLRAYGAESGIPLLEGLDTAGVGLPTRKTLERKLVPKEITPHSQFGIETDEVLSEHPRSPSCRPFAYEGEPGACTKVDVGEKTAASVPKHVSSWKYGPKLVGERREATELPVCVEADDAILLGLSVPESADESRPVGHLVREDLESRAGLAGLVALVVSAGDREDGDEKERMGAHAGRIA